MFSKAKRFEPIGCVTTNQKALQKQEIEKPKPHPKIATVASKSKNKTVSCIKSNSDVNSQCSSLQSVKSFVTPRPVKGVSVSKTPASLKNQKVTRTTSKNDEHCASDDIIKAQQVEIRNKDFTISEYNKQIEDLKTEIACLRKQMKEALKYTNDVKEMDNQFSQIILNDVCDKSQITNVKDQDHTIVMELQKLCERLEKEVSTKQVELSSLEEVITIRDSLCKDLQEKLTNVETVLEETRQRLEMVKGHHALALEANESIRREYKAELETLKIKLEEEKQAIVTKSKIDQENVKAKYNALMESLKTELNKEKVDIVHELQQKLTIKDNEMKAKLEQIDEATCEKIKLCEIQFEERTRSINEHWTHQQENIKYLENETANLKHKVNLNEEKIMLLQKDITNLKTENDALKIEKLALNKQMDEVKDEAKQKYIDFENEINKLRVEVDIVNKEKNKFDMSLSVTRDIVQVLTMRLRESDSELEHLERKVQSLTNSNEILENELTAYKNSLNSTLLECNEYKEALVNILKSKAALAKEHTRIMEHNVSLIESLQNVEKEAYRELGSIKNDLIGDVELLKKESNSQIQMLREEVEKKRVLCELATEHAGHAAAAAEQSRTLLAHAAAEISRLEADNHKLHQQIEDQQSLVVELSLLRQENEELTMTLVKHNSIIEKMKKVNEQVQPKPKSPSVTRKSHKMAKENLPAIISPLRERNH